MEIRSKLYIKLDNEIIFIIKKAISTIGAESRFLEKVYDEYKTSYKSKYIIHHWFASNWIPLEILKTATNILNLDYLIILNNKNIRGSCGHEIRFRKEINPQIANLFGWILTDGCITMSDNNKIIIAQNDKEVLNKLKLILINNFDFKNEYIQIRKSNNNGFKSNNDCFYLDISSYPFKNILLDYYGFLPGKLKKTQIPSQILVCDDEIKKAFLAGCLEGDGNIYLIDNKKARLMITCKSKNLASQLKNLFDSLYGKTKVFYHKQKECYVIQIYSSEIITKIIIDFKKYFIHPKKIKNIESIITCDRFFKKLRIPLEDKYKKDLINRALTKIGNKRKMEGYKILANILSKYTNFTIKPATLYCSWKYTWHSIPFVAFMNLCKLTNEDFTKYTPSWLMEFLKIKESYQK